MTKKTNNPLLDKSYAFAVRIVKTYQECIAKHREYTLLRQLVRSGTSIGANSAEAQGAISKKDFIAKVHIAYKEAKETFFWLRLLRDTNYIEPDLAESLMNDCQELVRIMTAILKTAKI